MIPHTLLSTVPSKLVPITPVDGDEVVEGGVVEDVLVVEVVLDVEVG